MLLRIPYGQCGTEIAYAATQAFSQPAAAAPLQHVITVRCLCRTLSLHVIRVLRYGTETGYSVHNAECGTELVYASERAVLNCD
eukprot:3422321-Rhodomonas_salina.3